MSIRMLIAAALVLAATHALAQQRELLSERIARMDTNRDGLISKDEFVAARTAAFAERDRNGDGQLDSRDIPRRLARRMGTRLTSAQAHMDADGDGKISKEEFVEAGVRLFERADANGDGVLDSAEIALLQEALTERTQLRRPR